jgi:transposase
VAKGEYATWLEPEGLLLLEGWARDGLTEEQIAHNCGVNAATLYDWKKRFQRCCL